MPTLDFKGKPFVYSHHLSVPFRELKIDAARSLPGKAGLSLDDNLIIHGDNLHALKALLPKYAGKVDVIYIDPPYNTGNEGWAYNDNVNSPLMKEWLGEVVDGDDLERHDKWLCMMWPRLVLLRELLSETGTLFISINELERDNLVKVSKEIFGDECYLGTFIWKSRLSEDTRNKTGFSDDHEYVLILSNAEKIKGAESDKTKFKNPDDDPRGPWRSADMTGILPKSMRPNCHYDLTNPKTGLVYSCPPKGWRFDRKGMQSRLDEDRVLWPKEQTGRPRQKLYLNELTNKLKNVSSFIPNINTAMGTREISALGFDTNFLFPKPTELVKFVLERSTNEDAIVLDSFAGTGTTAQAVQALNVEDGGNRKFILIETENYADTITAERVRRVIQGVPKAKDEALKNGLGGSFTYCDLGDPIDMESFFGDSGSMPAYDQLASYIAYTATGEALGKAPKKPAKDWFIGEVGGVRLHLIYKPDGDFMKSHQAALDMETVKTIAAGNKSGKPSYVFAAAKYMGQSELTRDYDMTFCQLPYAIHRIMGDGVDG